MSGAVGVVVGVDEPVRCATRVREQRIEHLMFDLRIAADRARAADKGSDFIALHSCGHVRDRCRCQRLRNGERVSEFVDLDDVRNVAASADEPDVGAGENQRENKQPTGGYLPVAFAENEIGISLILFSSRFDVRICGHAHLTERPEIRATILCCTPGDRGRQSSSLCGDCSSELTRISLSELTRSKTLGWSLTLARLWLLYRALWV